MALVISIIKERSSNWMTHKDCEIVKCRIRNNRTNINIKNDIKFITQYMCKITVNIIVD